MTFGVELLFHSEKYFISGHFWTWSLETCYDSSLFQQLLAPTNKDIWKWVIYLGLTDLDSRTQPFALSKSIWTYTKVALKNQCLTRYLVSLFLDFCRRICVAILWLVAIQSCKRLSLKRFIIIRTLTLVNSRINTCFDVKKAQILKNMICEYFYGLDVFQWFLTNLAEFLMLIMMVCTILSRQIFIWHIFSRLMHLTDISQSPNSIYETSNLDYRWFIMVLKSLEFRSLAHYLLKGRFNDF